MSLLVRTSRCCRTSAKISSLLSPLSRSARALLKSWRRYGHTSSHISAQTIYHLNVKQQRFAASWSLCCFSYLHSLCWNLYVVGSICLTPESFWTWVFQKVEQSQSLKPRKVHSCTEICSVCRQTRVFAVSFLKFKDVPIMLFEHLSSWQVCK